MVWLQIVVAGNVNKNGTHVRTAAAGGEGGSRSGAAVKGEFYRKFDLGEWVYCMSHTVQSLSTYLPPASLATLPFVFVLTSDCNLPLVVCICVCGWKCDGNAASSYLMGHMARNCLRRGTRRIRNFRIACSASWSVVEPSWPIKGWQTDLQKSYKVFLRPEAETKLRNLWI